MLVSISEQIEKNRKSAFEHLVETKKQNIDTIAVSGNEYSYVTKREQIKKYLAFNSFNEYKNSIYFNTNKMERVCGFFFVLV